MGAAMRAFDWAATPLGPPERMARDAAHLPAHHAGLAPADVGVVGPELINFYNDAYLPIVGSKHPGALGQPAAQLGGNLGADPAAYRRRHGGQVQLFRSRDAGDAAERLP